MKKESEAYRPSNGTEGMIFDAEFCGNCEKDKAFRRGYTGEGNGCEIYGLSMLHEIDDPAYPKEWIIGDAGTPLCTAFEKIKTPEEKRAELQRAEFKQLEAAGQMRLF